MRVALEIQYDGTNFYGWQVQPNLRTVQGELEQALYTLLNEKCEVYGSGRTDRGVHALRQVAHFDYSGKIPPQNISYAINIILPKDVKVIKSYLVSDDFNARYSAKRKTYRYTFYLSDCELPLLNGYAEQIKGKVDINKMKSGAKLIEGTHDFKCFLASNSDVTNTVRTIYSCNVNKQDNLITIEVCGNGFLYNMVRTIAGTLYFMGRGTIDEKTLLYALENGYRSKVGKTVSAKGLTLVSVKYTDND